MRVLVTGAGGMLGHELVDTFGDHEVTGTTHAQLDVTDRAAVLEFLKSYDAAGVTKQIKWDETGEVAGNAVYSYKVEGGAIVVEGLIE